MARRTRVGWTSAPCPAPPPPTPGAGRGGGAAIGEGIVDEIADGAPNEVRLDLRHLPRLGRDRQGAAEVAIFLRESLGQRGEIDRPLLLARAARAGKDED